LSRRAPGTLPERTRSALLAAARAVRSHAHAPYSRFTVGAAVLDDAGRIHAGCNVENASYGLTVCAERNAVAAAVAAGAKSIRAAAIVTRLRRPPATPCGACRQVLAELAGDDVPILLAGPTGGAREERLGALLPQAFRLRGSVTSRRSR
jgi:cytidine deaminase